MGGLLREKVEQLGLEHQKQEELVERLLLPEA